MRFLPLYIAYMREDSLYEIYCAYLESLCDSKKIGKGKMSLMLMAQSEFDRFKKRTERSDTFRAKILCIARDKKISGLIERNL